MNDTRIALCAGVLLACFSAPALADSPATPLTEADALARAVEHNPTLRAALIELERAGLSVRGEQYRYRPTFIAEGGFLHRATPSLRAGGIDTSATDSLTLSSEITQSLPIGMQLGAQLQFARTAQTYVDPTGGGSVKLGPAYGLDLTFSVSQPLLRDLGRAAGLSALRTAEAQRDAASYAAARTASEVVQAVLGAHWELWYAEQAVAIQAEALAVAQRQLKEAEFRQEAGRLAPADVLPFRREVAAIDEALLSAKTLVRTRALELARQVGMPLQSAGLQAAGPPTPPDRVPVLADSLTMARDASPQLAELRATVEAARVSAELARNQARPRLDANAWLTLSGLGDDALSPALEQIGTFDAVSAFAGLRFEMPVNRTALRATEARARLAVDAAEQRLRDADERLAQAITERFQQLDAARARISLVEDTVRYSRESGQAQIERFNAGAGIALELLSARQDLREAELRLVRAQVDLALLGVDIDHLSGALLGARDIRLDARTR
ncbi:MAG: TolC family protein [Myxococcota bacterium]